jgi:hypothetical protein
MLASLARRFEISRRTAQRNIECMRDLLLAQQEYDTRRKGHYYAGANFALPASRVTQKNCRHPLARNLLADSAGGIIGQAIQSFGRKLLAATGEFGLDGKCITTAFSAIWHGYTPAEGVICSWVDQALIQNCRLSHPDHLTHYIGSYVRWIYEIWKSECKHRTKVLLLSGMTYYVTMRTLLLWVARET